MSLPAGEIAELMLANPRRPDESLTDWFDRIFAGKWAESRVIYERQAGEDDE